MKTLLLITLTLLALHVPHTWAQPITYDGCQDFRGIPVPSVMSNVDNVALATLDPYSSMPVIYYNPQVLSYFHPITRLFWYMHECGHHVLEHTVGSAHPFAREKQADCWAIRKMSQLGQLNRQTMMIIQRDISQLPGDGWVYLPGPQRAISFSSC